MLILSVVINFIQLQNAHFLNFFIVTFQFRDLQYNQLNGKIPDSFGGLIQLSELYVDFFVLFDFIQLAGIQNAHFLYFQFYLVIFQILEVFLLID